MCRIRLSCLIKEEAAFSARSAQPEVYSITLGALSLSTSRLQHMKSLGNTGGDRVQGPRLCRGYLTTITMSARSFSSAHQLHIHNWERIQLWKWVSTNRSLASTPHISISQNKDAGLWPNLSNWVASQRYYLLIYSTQCGYGFPLKLCCSYETGPFFVLLSRVKWCCPSELRQCQGSLHSTMYLNYV